MKKPVVHRSREPVKKGMPQEPKRHHRSGYKLRGRTPKPISEQKVKRWLKWPKMIAMHTGRYMGGRGHLEHSGMTILGILRGCAIDLCEKFNPPLKLSDVVVFYPKRFRSEIAESISKNPKRRVQYRGLTIAPTNRLNKGCRAFVIEDVRNHRTPADAYFVIVERPARRDPPTGINPNPIYNADESGTGKEIHE